MVAHKEIQDLVLRLGLVSSRNMKNAIEEAGDSTGVVWDILRTQGLLSDKEADLLQKAESSSILLEDLAAQLRSPKSGAPHANAGGVVDALAATPILDPRIHGSGGQKRQPDKQPTPIPKETDSPRSNAASAVPSTEVSPPVFAVTSLRPVAPPPQPRHGMKYRPGTERTADAAVVRPARDSREESGGRPGSCSSLQGKHLGRYHLTSLLGRGACGSVFMAHHEKLNIPVAVKVLEPAMIAAHPEFLYRFTQEARAAAAISHPNVVRVLDCDEIDGFHLIVMEYVDGISMAELIQMNGLILEDRALVFAKQVADALESALSVGIIHRDIKPANIMVTKSKQVKLADLGLAKRVDDPSMQSGTNPNVGLGTPNYFAPEQAINAAAADHRSDIYALGTTLFHMLTGQVPFHGKNVPEIVYKQIHEKVRPPDSVVGVITPETSRLVVRMMEKDPKDRYQSYPELINAIEECIVIAKRRDLITRDTSTHIAPPAELRVNPQPRRGMFKLFHKRGGDS